MSDWTCENEHPGVELPLSVPKGERCPSCDAAEPVAATTLEAGWCGAHGYHGRVTCQRCSSNLHPFECDGLRKCVHCDRRNTAEHDPATCELCDPEYDMRLNPFRDARIEWEGRLESEPPSGDARPDPRTHPEFWTE